VPPLPWETLFAWGSLGTAALLLGLACRDVATVPYGDMGVQMYYSGRWLLGSLAAGAGAGLLLAWWAGALIAVAIYLLRWPVYRLFEGRSAEPLPPPKDGFKEFIRRAERND
jgi:hypothetical protein